MNLNNGLDARSNHMTADKSLVDQSPGARDAASSGESHERDNRNTSIGNDLEERTALRWRRAILRLSETLLSAADERQDLSPILLEAMHNALENLLVYGEEHDLMALEEWLIEGDSQSVATD